MTVRKVSGRCILFKATNLMLGNILSVKHQNQVRLLGHQRIDYASSTSVRTLRSSVRMEGVNGSLFCKLADGVLLTFK